MIIIDEAFLLEKYGDEEAVKFEKIDLDKNLIFDIDKQAFRLFGKLKTLRLSINELSQLHFSSFIGLKNLTLLTLDRNQIECIEQKTFKTLSNLISLHLSQNRIELIDFEAFEGLNNLQYLYLHENCLKSIDKLTFKPLTNLTQLYLQDNLIESIEPDTFQDLSNLTELKLQSNIIKKIVKGTFNGLVSLVKLNLENNELQSIENDAFSDCKNLKILILSDNQLTKIDSNSFGKLNSLECLYLDNNRIESIDAEAFKDLVALTSLYLSSNNLTTLDSYTFSSLSKLERLHLSINQIEILAPRTFKCLENSIKWIGLFRNYKIFYSYIRDLTLTNDRLSHTYCLNNFQQFLEQFSTNQLPNFSVNNLIVDEDGDKENGVVVNTDGRRKSVYIDPLVGKIYDNGKFVIRENIGQGAYGRVYSGNNTEDNSKVAIKAIYRLGIHISEKQMKEIEILGKIHNQHIIRYLGHFKDDYHLFVVTELCHDGNLSEKINEYAIWKKNFDKLRVIDWLLQACSGLDYLHSTKKIIHRDIKPENIFLTKNGSQLKLGDLGFALIISSSLKSKSSKSSDYSMAGTYPYMSPEMLAGHKYKHSTDIWSLGCVSYELVFLKVPFDPSTNDRNVDRLNFNNEKFTQIILKTKEMLSHDANSRPKASDLEKYFSELKQSSR